MAEVGENNNLLGEKEKKIEIEPEYNSNNQLHSDENLIDLEARK